MLIETILSGLGGGILRLAPEILKLLDRGSERKHELAMQDKALAFEQLRGASRMAEINAAGQAALDLGAMDALREALTAQGRPSGIPWADALSLTVRPVITYWFMLLYCSVKMSCFAMAVRGGADWVEAVKLMWSPEDMAIFAMLLNFWFVGRVLEKKSA